MNSNLFVHTALFLLLLKSVAFLALVFALWLIVRRRSAAFQSLYWQVSMLALAALAVFSLWIPIMKVEWTSAQAGTVSTATSSGASRGVYVAGEGWRVLEPGAALPSETATSGSPAAASSAANSHAASPRNWWLLTWSIGAAFLLLLFGLSRMRLSRLRSTASPATEHHAWRSQLEESKKGVRFRRRVDLLLSNKLVMPCAWGVFRATVMLPAQASKWDEEKRQMVLMHELAHLGRRDPFYQLAGRLCLAIFWMNPLAWLAWKQMRLAEERATDDAVLASGCEPKSYAELLFEFVKQGAASPRRISAAASAMAQRSTVGVRVEKILDASTSRAAPCRTSRVLVRGLILAGAALLGGIAFVEAQEPAGKDSGKKEEAKKEDKEGTTGRLKAAPAVDPRLELEKKLKAMILPHVQFDNAAIEDVCLFVREQSKQLDPDKKGINIVAHKLKNSKPVTLNLQNVPLLALLNYSAEFAGAKVKIEPHVVTLVDAAEDANTRYTRTFRVPAGFKERLGGEEGPKAGIAELLKKSGVEFPAGTSVTLQSGKLIIRNTQKNMELVQALVDEAIKSLPAMVHARFELYRLSNLDALKLIERYDKKGDVSEGLVELRKMVEAGKATLEGSPSVTTRGAVRAGVGEGREHNYVASFIEKDGKDFAVEKSIFLGTFLEIDPVLGKDGATLDVTFALTRTFGEPKFGKRKVTAPVSGQEKEVDTIDVVQGGVQTAVTYTAGQTRFVGSMRAPKPGGGEETILILAKMWLTRSVDAK